MFQWLHESTLMYPLQSHEVRTPHDRLCAKIDLQTAGLKSMLLSDPAHPEQPLYMSCTDVLCSAPHPHGDTSSVRYDEACTSNIFGLADIAADVGLDGCSLLPGSDMHASYTH